jgi:hypothetical protein
LRPLPPQNFLHAEMGLPSEMTAGFFFISSLLRHPGMRVRSAIAERSTRTVATVDTGSPNW